MKRIILFVFLFFILIVDVYANEIEDTLNTLSNQIEEIVEKYKFIQPINKYPIGSIYITTSATNPSEIVGGEWEAFATGRTLVGVSSSGQAEVTGGVASKTLVADNLPGHTHTYTASGTVASTFTGTKVTISNTVAHTHTFPAIVSGSVQAGYGLMNSTVHSFGGRTFVSGLSGGYSTGATEKSHSHTVTPKGTVSSTFTGKKANSSSLGSGTAINILNPYITVYMWKRVA